MPKSDGAHEFENPENEQDARYKKMVSVEIIELLAFEKTPVDIYIRLSQQRFVRFFKANEKIEINRLDPYRAKNQKVFFCSDADYQLLIDRTIFICGVAVTRREIKSSQKILLLHKMSDSVFSEITELGFNPASFEHSKQIVKSLITVIESKVSLYDLFQTLLACDEEIVVHSVAVTAIATMIAKEVGWTIPATLEKLALGAMLHDVGLKEISPALLKKPRTAMNHDHMQEYETHCYRGMVTLQSLGIVPDDVIAIAYEHHELGSGQGYPRHMKSMHINPLAKVVALADCFIELTFKSTNNMAVKTPKEALHAIKVTMGQPFQRDVFMALERIVRG